MNRKEVKTVEEVEEFIEPLATGEFVIDIRPLPDNGGFSIEWQPHKTYVAFGDGKEYPDELWRTEDGRLLLVQDLEPEHCRNILRMILRQERETSARLGSLLETLINEVYQEEESTPGTDEPAKPENGKYLH